MKVHFPEERINGFAQIQVLGDDGKLIIAFYGPTAAIVTEEYFRNRLGEKTVEPIRVGDIFARHDRQRIAEIVLTKDEKAVLTKIGNHPKSVDKYNWGSIYLPEIGLNHTNIKALESLRNKELFYFNDNEIGSELGIYYGRLSALGKKYLGILPPEGM